MSGEIAQTLVKKMLNVEEGSSEEVITGEIENILNDEFVKIQCLICIKIIQQQQDY